MPRSTTNSGSRWRRLDNYSDAGGPPACHPQAAAQKNAELRKAAWASAMRLVLFEQTAALDALLAVDERRAMDGDIIALDIRRGIVDRNTLRGSEQFFASTRR